MTRINCGIPVEVLSDWHLIAEIDEIPTVLDVYHNRILKGITDFRDIPKNFTLGKGHILFFLNKLYYLHKRFKELALECIKRDLVAQTERKDLEFLYKGFNNIKLVHYLDYAPTQKDRDLLVTRISTRIIESDKSPWYYGKRITKEEAIEKLLTVGKIVENKDNQLNLYE